MISWLWKCLLCTMLLYFLVGLPLLPLLYPPLFQHEQEHRHLLVIPFVRSQIDKLQFSLQRWNLYPPCRTTHFDVAFFIDSTFTLILRQTVEHMWSQLDASVRHCFHHVLFLEGHLNESLGHPQGPCASFFAVTHMFRADAFVFQLMEPDNIPIRSFWLDALQKEAQQLQPVEGRCPVWMQGSVSRCPTWYGDIQKRQDLHINGNSMYCVDEEFLQFLDEVRRFYPGTNGCQTAVPQESGYDHTFYHYLHSSVSTRNKYLPKFRYTDIIQNRCDDAYNLSDIQIADPHTYLVHGKAAHYSASEHQVISAFHHLMHLTPNRETLLLWKARLVLREETNESLPAAICLHRLHNSESFDPLLDKLACPGMPHWRSTLTNRDWRTRYQSRTYLWTADFHPSPVMCNVDLWVHLNITIHMEVDHALCRHFGVCKDRLKILQFDNWAGLSLENNKMTSATLRQQFFEWYRQDPEFQRVDIISVSHPAANLELFVPFLETDRRKRLLVYLTTRLEFGRHDSLIDWRVRQPFWSPDTNRRRWKELLETIQSLAHSNQVIFVSNNRYDAKYFQYFTGIRIPVVQSWCQGEMFPAAPYLPTEDDYLIGPLRDNLNLGNCSWYGCEPWNHPVLLSLVEVLKQENATIKFTRMQDRYPAHSKSDFTRHPGIILIPYQASVMSVVELYRQNIPMFAPSVRLLIQWIRKYDLVWERIYGHPEESEESEEFDESVRKHPNPNSNQMVSLQYWVPLFDIYHLPFIHYFDSWHDLLVLLQDLSFERRMEISRQMKQWNTKQRSQLLNAWQEIFQRLGRVTL
jgi:hypothetical protein